MSKSGTYIPPEFFGLSDEEAQGLYREGVDVSHWQHFTPEFVGTKAQSADIEELTAHARRATEIYEEGRLSQAEGFVQFANDLPVTVFFIGDVHIGSYYTDHDLFMEHMRRIAEMPNAYIVFMSNLVDNAIPSQFPSNMLVNGLPPDKQVVYMRHVAEELNSRGKVLGAVTSSCHEGWCVSNDTEALTRNRGWVTDVEIGEEILTYNIKAERFEYLPVKDKYRGEYDGKMYHFENDNVDLLCTPQHKMLYQQYHWNKKSWETRLRQAENVRGWIGKRFWQTASFSDESELDISDGLLRLLAWVITEGTIPKKGNQLRIYQSSKNLVDCERIRGILRDNNLSFSETRHPSGFGGKDVVGFNFTSEEVRTYLDRGKLRIPIKILSYSSTRQRELFLSELMLGDGMRREFTFCTSSPTLAGDVQELAIKTGIKATVRKRKGVVMYDVYMKEPNGRNGGLYVYPVRRKENNPTLDKYNGEVWCPHTDNGTFVSRRNGKVCITGNTYKHTGQDINALIFGFPNRRFPVLQNGGRLHLQFPSREYVCVPYHKIGPFESNFNETHGLRQMNRLRQNMEADIVVGAHKHFAAAEVVYEGTGRRVKQVAYVRSGCYKGVSGVDDRFAVDNYGTTGEPGGQSVTILPQIDALDAHLSFEVGMLAQEVCLRHAIGN